MSSPRSRRTVAAVGAVLTTLPLSLLSGAVPAAADPLPPPIGGFASGVYIPLNDWPVSGAGSGALLLNGNLSLTWADTSLEPTVDEQGQLTELETALGLRGAVTLDLRAETSGDIEETFELLTVPVGSFPAGPAQITSYLGLNLRISGEADAGAQVGLVAPFNITAALHGIGGRPTTSIPTAPAFDPEIGLPDLAGALSASLTVELEATLTFQISVPQLPLPIGGPVFATSVGTTIDLEPGGTPWWRLTASAGVKYGWSVPDVTGLPEPPRRMQNLIPRQEWQVARAHDAGPAVGTSTRWSTAYDVLNNGDVGGLLADGDSLTLIQQGSSPDSFPWLATLDGAGVPQSQTQTTELASFVGLARAADGASIGISPVGEIWRFDGAGTAQWARAIVVTDAALTSWKAVVGTVDGTVQVGSTYASDRPVVLGLDHDGQVRWVTEIDLDAPFERTALTALAAAPDGSVIAVGSTVDITDPARDFNDLLVARIGSDGIVRSAVAYGGSLTDTATAVAVQPDGSYAVIGTTSASSGSDAVVARFDGQDQLLWSGIYRDSEPADGRVVPTGITAIGSGDYVMSGTTANIPDAWLMRIDSTGMPVWSKSFLGADADKLTDVVAMPVGVAAAGDSVTADSASTQPDTTWVVRTSVDGMVHFDPSTGLSTVNRAVQWSLTDSWVLRSLTWTESSPGLTISDERFGSTPAAAVVRPLT